MKLLILLMIRAVVSSEDFPAASEVCQYTPDIIINCKDTACINAEAYVPEP